MPFLKDGNKTYSLVIAGIMAAISAFLAGQTDVAQLVEHILIALGFATVRHGVSTTAKAMTAEEADK